MQMTGAESEKEMYYDSEAGVMSWRDRLPRFIRRPSLDSFVATSRNPGNLFGDINKLKDTDVREQMAARKDREKAKYKDGVIGSVAKSDIFERMTLVVISLNAISIGIDADYTARIGKPDNLYEAPLFFIFSELFFATYFSGEIFIRFVAYRKKCQVFCDFWFVFDTALVSLMLVEVLVVPFLGSDSPLGQLSVLRLLRLLRITRVAKLMRMFPELMLIVTGIKAAVKAVCWTAILLVLITFTWAILFTNEYHQGKMSNEEARELDGAEHLFGSLSKSMISLLVMGTILDDVTYATDTIRATEKKLMLLAFILYILLNSFTMMNMLIGILVEVVGSTSEQEQMRLTGEQATDAIREIFEKMDDDGNKLIRRDEFQKMRNNPKVGEALRRLKIDGKQFETFADLFFEVDEDDGVEQDMSFDKLLEMIMRLRPGTHVSALDFATLKQHVYKGQAELLKKLTHFEKILDMQQRVPPGSFAGFVPEGSDTSSINTPLLRHTGSGSRPKASFGAAPQVITMNMLVELEGSSLEDIVAEIQRRLGMPNLEEAGVPLALMDEELQQRFREVECITLPGALIP